MTSRPQTMAIQSTIATSRSRRCWSEAHAELTSAARYLPLGIGLVALLFVHACSARLLPPTAVPRRVVPSVVSEVPPPSSGEGRVVLDADGAARVDEVIQRSEATALPQVAGIYRGTVYVGPQRVTRPLCLTPCAVNLAFGHHEVLFSVLDDPSRTSTGFINVGSSPSIARHAIGQTTSSPGGLIGALVMGMFSIAGFVTGPVLLGFGDDEARGRTGFVTAGWLTLGIGAALGAGAVALGLASRPTVQPGSTVQWVPATGAP